VQGYSPPAPIIVIRALAPAPAPYKPCSPVQGICRAEALADADRARHTARTMTIFMLADLLDDPLYSFACFGAVVVVSLIWMWDLMIE
jgi:hypothetical protein